jgi:hypothetical protein
MISTSKEFSFAGAFSETLASHLRYALAASLRVRVK